MSTNMQPAERPDRNQIAVKLAELMAAHRDGQDGTDCSDINDPGSCGTCNTLDSAIKVLSAEALQPERSRCRSLEAFWSLGWTFRQCGAVIEGDRCLNGHPYKSERHKAAPPSSSAPDPRRAGREDVLSLLSDDLASELRVQLDGSAPERADDGAFTTIAGTSHLSMASGAMLTTPVTAPAGDGALQTRMLLVADKWKRGMVDRRTRASHAWADDAADLLIQAAAALSAPVATPAQLIPPEWAEAANSARGLCENEANKWEKASPSTSEHWRSVAVRLGAIYLTQDHLVVPSVPPAGDGDVVQIIPPFRHPGYTIRRAKPRPFVDEEEPPVPPAGGEARTAEEDATRVDRSSLTGPAGSTASTD